MRALDAALWWQSRSGAVVPLQPNSKHLIAGFGAHSDQVRDVAGAGFWFGERACNLGIITGHGVICLDFDTEGEYREWHARAGDDGQTLTERTARGYHIFYSGSGASGRVGGIEVMGVGKVVAVAPSTVAGFQYHLVAGCGGGLRVLPPAFFLLSDSPAVATGQAIAQTVGSGDTVTRIKRAWAVADVARDAGVIWSSRSRDGRWLRGYCPFHGDEKPSFWVDTERGTWGCYAGCGHGDVINLYALWKRLSVTDAIGEMVGILS